MALPRLGPLPPNVRVDRGADRFDVVMTEILDGLEGAGNNLAPAFAFVDPFGFSDTPMNLIGRILAHPRSEVFDTVMLENVNRFLEHPNPVHEGLLRVCGRRAGWHRVQEQAVYLRV